MIIRTIYIVNNTTQATETIKNHRFKCTLSALRYIKNLKKKNKGCTITLNKPLVKEKSLVTMRAEWEKYKEGGGTQQEFIDDYMDGGTQQEFIDDYMDGGTQQEFIDDYMCDFKENYHMSDCKENDYSMGKPYNSKATNLSYLERALAFNREEMEAEKWIWKALGELTTFENYLEIKYKTRLELLVALNRHGARIQKSRVKGKLNAKL